MNQKEENRSQPSSNILSRPFWNKKSHCTAVCSNFVAWIRSRKILEWNSPKGAWSLTSLSFLQHIFYNSSFNKSSLAGIFHANDFPLTGSSLVQRLRCPCPARVFLPRSSPTNQPMPLGPFRASGRCRNSENREFCAHFPSLSMSPNMPTCPGHIGVKELFSKYWQEGSASSKGRAKSCYLFQHFPIFIICVCVFESLSLCVLEFSSLSLRLLVRGSLSLCLCVS